MKILKLELERARKVYDKRLLAFIVVGMIASLAFFFLVLSSGGYYQNSFYTYDTEDEQLQGVLLSNPRFVQTLEPQVYMFIDQKLFIIPSGFRGMAAASSALQSFKEYNRYVEYSFNYTPLLLLQVISANQTPSNVSVGDAAPGSSGFNLLGFDEEESLDLSNMRGQSGENNLNREVHDNTDAQRIPRTPVNVSGYMSTDDLEPRMPFDQIYLSLSFIVLLTFISLMYTNRIMDEKVNKKGILLLVAPISRMSILVQKTLPYYAAASILTFILGLIQGLSLERFLFFLLTSQSIILPYIAISLFIAMSSRSFKELSFLGVFSLSIYSLLLFIPVFLINFSDASIASPLATIVLLFMGKALSLQEVLFSSVPHLFLSVSLFYMSYALYHPETFFHYQNLGEKIRSFYRASLKNNWDYIIAGFSVVYFGYVLQILTIVFFVATQKQGFLWVVLISAAFIEEFLRNAPLYMHWKMGKKNGLLAAVLVGIGFFAAEKFVLMLSVMPFRETLALIYYSALIIPLVVHIGLGVIYRYLIPLVKRHWIAAIITGIVHFAVNYYIFSIALAG